MSKKLKPCPFCGAKEDDEDEPLVRFWILGIDDYQICCDKCGANTGWFGRNMEEAIEAWNSRAEPEIMKLTDMEQRIFLAAMAREEKVCGEADRNYTREPYKDILMSVCKSIKRKVKGALWGT